MRVPAGLPRGLWRGVCGLLLAGFALAPVADAQMPALPNERLAGLQWTFARIRYNSCLAVAPSQFGGATPWKLCCSSHLLR